MEKILTIVVPSYNVEKYLRKNLDSMLDPQVLEDIEIIVVDDGSTKDRTPEIADEYANKYPDTVRVIHKENGGHGSAINVTMPIARGKYYCILDADDFMNTNTWVEYINRLKGVDADIVLHDYQVVNPEYEVIGKRVFPRLPKEQLLPLDNYLKKILRFGNLTHNRIITFLGTHTVVTKTQILRDNPFHVTEHHPYEDAEYSLYYTCHAKTFFYIPMVQRNYLVGTSTQSVNHVSKQRYYKHYEDIIHSLVNIYNNANLSPNYDLYAMRMIAHYLTGLVATYLSFDSPEKKQELMNFDSWLKETCPAVYRANRNVALAFLRLTKFSLYSLGAKIYNRTMM